MPALVLIFTVTFVIATAATRLNVLELNSIGESAILNFMANLISLSVVAPLAWGVRRKSAEWLYKSQVEMHNTEILSKVHLEVISYSSWVSLSVSNQKVITALSDPGNDRLYE